ncbi:hypothetical protein PsaNZ64_00740 [Pseudomonas syringae pv. actinidiae]|uniref:hypothetical protein n=1 Tax=Pseudomonas syringae TaxID=317 RepID=UPI000940B795|nr:hypothetical protein [Pseudomonas syringae]OKS78841.1 hypothetical protein PsaNZ64_00740 [Pseudomonas syringae pv. actinidiae]
MRVTRQDFADALEQVRTAFNAEAVAQLLEHDMFPGELHGLLDEQGANGEPEAMLRAIAGAVAVINIAQRNDRAAGLDSTFLSQANLIRAGHVRGSLMDDAALADLFPQLVDQYGPDSARELRGGIAFHLASRFFLPEGQESGIHQQLLRVAVMRSAEVEGELQPLTQIAVREDVVGVDQMLVAVNAIHDVTRGANLPLSQGLMIGHGACEFNVGLAPIHQVIRDLHPDADDMQVSLLTERTLGYLHQFNGQVVNQVLQEIGNEWLAENAEAYLAGQHHEVDQDDDLDMDDEAAQRLLIEVMADNEDVNPVEPSVEIPSASLDFKM